MHLSSYSTAVSLSTEPKQTLEALTPQIAWENGLKWFYRVCIREEL